MSTSSSDQQFACSDWFRWSGRRIPDLPQKLIFSCLLSSLKPPQPLANFFGSPHEQRQNFIIELYLNKTYSACNCTSIIGKKRKLLVMGKKLDCYFSLSKVAKEDNYCRPHMIDSVEPVFSIHQGWHPIITKIMGEENQFVANDLDMSTKCYTLFVTHYPPVVELEKHYPENISVVHMGYILKDNEDDLSDIETVTFLYNVVSGVSEKSYGINVAALAGIPKDVLLEAQKISQLTEFRSIIKRKIKSLMQKLTSASSNC
ncbi:DNA mismatch repair protein Msh3 [Araneus ventricosus]|uniref:DNA mismatch repair protein Msh3 n=1 Tax=Araneus ventricosus TaxID=182803 RepID=A0A4Y2JEF2_ARAVE|nr:DNA mismatch repair protein Msh3 [Araneus ventricosus]